MFSPLFSLRHRPETTLSQSCRSGFVRADAIAAAGGINSGPPHSQPEQPDAAQSLPFWFAPKRREPNVNLFKTRINYRLLLLPELLSFGDIQQAKIILFLFLLLFLFLQFLRFSAFDHICQTLGDTAAS